MKAENRARVLLMKVGVDPALKGYDYLIEAVKICYEDKKMLHLVTKRLYPDIAKMFSTTAGGVERAMRHSIENLMEYNPEGFYILNFPFAVSGKVTNSQFIGACVEYLKIHEED